MSQENLKPSNSSETNSSRHLKNSELDAVTLKFRSMMLSTPQQEKLPSFALKTPSPFSIAKDFITPDQQNANYSARTSIALPYEFPPVLKFENEEPISPVVNDIDLSEVVSELENEFSSGRMIDLEILRVSSIRIISNIASFLGNDDLKQVISVSQSWKRIFDCEEVWKCLFKRNSGGFCFGQRSWCFSWKCMIQKYSSISRALELRENAIHMDLSTYLSVSSTSETSVEFNLNGTGLKLMCSFELFPGFFWIICEKNHQHVVFGAFLDENNQIAKLTGLPNFRRIIQSTCPAIRSLLTVRTVVLMLFSLNALPGDLDLECLIQHAASFLEIEPNFNLQLAVSMAALGSKLKTFYTSSSIQRENINFASKLRSNENFNPKHGADLQLREIDGVLKWKLTLRKRRATSQIQDSRQVFRQRLQSSNHV